MILQKADIFSALIHCHVLHVRTRPCSTSMYHALSLNTCHVLIVIKKYLDKTVMCHWLFYTSRANAAAATLYICYLVFPFSRLLSVSGVYWNFVISKLKQNCMQLGMCYLQ